MRKLLLAIPLALAATPALAAPATGAEDIRIPPELTDPRFVERITGMTEALTRALMNMPVGEMEAIAQGRQVTDADRRRTVGDATRLSEQDLQQQIAAARPAVQGAMQAFARSLPAVTRSLSEAAREIERVTENMPRPDYPRR